jgi:hypothetical protein
LIITPKCLKTSPKKSLRAKENSRSAGCSGSTQSAKVVKQGLFPAVAISRRALKILKKNSNSLRGSGCEMLPSQPAFAQLIIRRAMNLKQFLKPDWRKFLILNLKFQI